MKKELLVPVGNISSLKVAVAARPDAIYISGKNFGARKFAGNFTDNELVDAIGFCHLYGVKVYVTMNTLVKNNEVMSFIRQARFLHQHGVDAILVQDFGMICLLREMFPNLIIHVSTQANNCSLETINLYYKLGVKRVVLPRELSIEEINSIDIPIEKEVFVHGALCISYSGCCLMSSMLGGRSGNRGECSGPCRLAYTLLDNNIEIIKNKYLLSTKELNTTSYIKELLDSNIDSLKIEGRMKSSLYVGFITNLYRNLLDNKDINLNKETDKLKTIFNREFTKGRLFNEDDKDIMNIDSPNHQGLIIGTSTIFKNKIKITLNKGYVLNQYDSIRFVNSSLGMTINYLYDSRGRLISSSRDVCYIDNILGLTGDDIVSKTKDYMLEREYLDVSLPKINIKIRVIARANEELEVTISDGDNTINKKFNIIKEAINSPINKNDIIKHLTKLGNTPFICNDIEVVCDNNIFIRVGDLNNTRRCLVNELINKRKQYMPSIYLENTPKFIVNSKNIIKPKFSCSVETLEQLECVLSLGIERVYVSDYDLYLKYKNDSRVIYNIPRCRFNVFYYNRMLTSDYIDFSRSQVYGNYPLNVFNIYTAYYLNKFGLNSICISPELSVGEINDFIYEYKTKFNSIPNFEVLVYGRVENMIIKGNGLNISSDKFRYRIRDIKKREFPVYYESGMTHILNYRPLKLETIENVTMRFDFYHESSEEIKRVVKSYQ